MLLLWSRKAHKCTLYIRRSQCLKRHSGTYKLHVAIYLGSMVGVRKAKKKQGRKNPGRAVKQKRAMSDIDEEVPRPEPVPVPVHGRSVSRDLLGRKVSMLWPDDEEWYEARVFNYTASKKTHHIIYDGSNDVETHNLWRNKKRRPHKFVFEEEEDELFGQIIHCTLDEKNRNEDDAPQKDFRAMVIGTEFELPDEEPVDDPDEDDEVDEDRDADETETEDEDENNPPEFGPVETPGGDWGSVKVQRSGKSWKARQKSGATRSDGKVKKYQLIYLETEFLRLVDLRKVRYHKVDMDSMRSKQHVEV